MHGARGQTPVGPLALCFFPPVFVNDADSVRSYAQSLPGPPSEGPRLHLPQLHPQLLIHLLHRSLLPFQFHAWQRVAVRMALGAVAVAQHLVLPDLPIQPAPRTGVVTEGTQRGFVPVLRIAVRCYHQPLNPPPNVKDGQVVKGAIVLLA